MSAVEAYRKAVEDLRAAVQDAERTVKIVHDASTQLKDWRRAVVSNVGGGYPADLAVKPGHSIDGSLWPTAHQLSESLARYHRAKAALRAAYDAIPEGLKELVYPPETFDSERPRGY